MKKSVMQIYYSKSSITKMIFKYKYLYLLILPAIIYFAVFSYGPMYGIIIAFKKYRFIDGIFGSAWVGFDQFQKMFNSPTFYEVLWNTIFISFLRIIFGFPAPIILALLLNELKSLKFKKVVQTISYLPHFISWVVLAGIINEVFSPSRGIVNYIITLFGGETKVFMTNPGWFIPILISTGIWQGIGWGTILYLAAISNIDIQLYEAAKMDGANRFKQAIHVTLPSLIPVISILFILGIGGILNAGFDQIFNLYNPLVYKVSDIIDTYTYRVGLINSDFSYSTAVGLFKNVVGLILMVITNFVLKPSKDYGIW